MNHLAVVEKKLPKFGSPLNHNLTKRQLRYELPEKSLFRTLYLTNRDSWDKQMVLPQTNKITIIKLFKKDLVYIVSGDVMAWAIDQGKCNLLSAR